MALETDSLHELMKTLNERCFFEVRKALLEGLPPAVLGLTNKEADWIKGATPEEIDEGVRDASIPMLVANNLFFASGATPEANVYGTVAMFQTVLRRRSWEKTNA